MINKEITLWRQLVFQRQISWETLKNQSMIINAISRKLWILATSCNSLIVWHVAWQISKIGRAEFVLKCTSMVKNLSTFEFDISKWLVKRLVKLRIHRIHKQICYVWKLHSIESFHSITIFERLHAIIPARIIIHFPLHCILFNPNSPIKPTRLIYKLFGPLYIFIVSFIFSHTFKFLALLTYSVSFSYTCQ